MNKSRKFLFLILILTVPVIIFLFLRLFGTNEFTVPVYYESGAPADTLGCSYTDTAPYRVPMPDNSNGNTVILLDGGSELMAQSDRNNLLRRIKQNTYEGLRVIVFFDKELGAPIPMENIRYIPKSTAAWGNLLCQFVTSEERQLILVDDERRIRGYYGLDLEEVDRLLVEIEILAL